MNILILAFLLLNLGIIYLRLGRIEKYIKRKSKPKREAGVMEFYAVIDGQLQRTEFMELELGKKVQLSLKFFKDISSDAPGRAPEGIPAWTMSDGSIVSIEVAEDGKSAFVKPVAEGTVQVTATLGNLSDTMEISAVLPLAGVMKIVAGEPVDA